MIQSLKTILLVGALLLTTTTPQYASATTRTSQLALSEQLQMLVVDIQNIALNDFLNNLKAEKSTLEDLEERTYALIEDFNEDSTELTEDEKKLSADKMAQCLQILKMYDNE